MEFPKINRSLKRGFDKIDIIYPELKFATKEKKTPFIAENLYKDNPQMEITQKSIFDKNINNEKNSNSISNNQLAEMLMIPYTIG